MNKWITTNKLPVANKPILIFLVYYISVVTTGFLLDYVIPLESLDLHSGSSTNSIYIGIIDLHTNLVPANNSSNNKLDYHPVWKRGEVYYQSPLFFFILFTVLVVCSLSFLGCEHWCAVSCSLIFYCCSFLFYWMNLRYKKCQLYMIPK